MPNLIARAHRATGDMVSAVIFLRIAFWYSQAVKADREWTAQSYDNLMDETACSQKQVRRSITVLRTRELVLTKRGLFANRNVLHFKVTLKGQQALEGTFKPALEGQFEPALEGQFYIQGETTGSDNKEISELALAATPDHSQKDGNHMKVEDVLASGKFRKHVHKPGTPKELEYTWKAVFAEVYDQGMVYLTQKQIGQLKHFAAKCPEGTAAKVLEWVLRNWIEFVKDVETKAGLKKTPSQPSIDFLLPHAGVAVELALPKEGVSPEKVKVAKKGLVTSKTVQLISQNDSPKTFDELISIIGGGKSKE